MSTSEPDDLIFAHLQEHVFARATAATLAAYSPDRKLSGTQIVDYLDRHSFLTVSSTRPDGRPHSALSSFVRQGATFWLPTMARTVREKNVRHQPWLVLVLSEGQDNAHVAIIIEGPATVISPAAVPSDVAAKFTGTWVSAWLRLEAERVLSYGDEGAVEGGTAAQDSPAAPA